MQVCRLQKIAFFLRHCRRFFKFPSFRHNALKKKQKYQNLFEKRQKNDKEMTMLQDIYDIFCHLQNCHVLSLFVSFCHMVNMLLSFCIFGCRFRTNIEKYQKLIANGREIAPKNTSKNAIFCNLQNCHFFDLLVPFLSRVWKKEKKLIRTMTKTANASRKKHLCNVQNDPNYSRNDRPKLKWPKMIQKMTIEMADKIDMTKNVRQNWSDKNKWQTNDTQNDRQSWNDKQITTGTAKIWQIRYFEFFNLCLHKFLLTLRMSNLCEVDVGPFTKTRLKYGWGCTPWLAGCVPAVAHCQHVAAEQEGKNLWASAGD